MKKNLVLKPILLCVLFLSGLDQSYSQNYRSLLNKLIESEYTVGDSVSISVGDSVASIDIHDSDDPWSVSYTIIDHTDLNHDQTDDYIVRRDSYGMLGGNVKSNNSIFYYIMKDKDIIKDTHEILLYAPFSFNIADSVSYDKSSQMLTIRFVKNYRTYFDEDGQNDETMKRFKYIDNNLYELSYLSDCELGKLKNKNIFQPQLSNVTHNRSIDMDNYTETSSESFITNNLAIEASMTGCDNINLKFDIVTTLDKDLYTEILNVLTFLSNNTLYGLQLKNTKDKMEAIKELVDLNNLNSSSLTLGEIKDGWTADFYGISKNEQSQKLSFKLVLCRDINKNQNENWDITVRRK